MSRKQTDLALTCFVALLIILFSREILGQQTNRHNDGAHKAALRVTASSDQIELA
jgi:hypothetical protein